MPLRLYNTLTRKVEEFVPADPARVTFYSCGPTVYDDAHIGNFRSFLAADVLRRWLESPLCDLATDPQDPTNPAKIHKGPRKVVHVMNITDVGHMTDDAEGGEAGEDRMAVAGRRLMEAKKAGTLPAGVEVNPGDPYQIARFYEGRFREDAKKLGLKVAIEAESDPTLMPRATENVAGMIAVIARLIGRGFAYVAGESGSRAVYFDVQKFGAYGRLSGNTLERLRSGAGGRISEVNQSQKRHAADFLLWKEDARHIMKWESPWGAGYPGWHIECTAMAAARLGSDGVTEGQSDEVDALRAIALPDGAPLIDLHSGGEDNIFPHHECEIAQSCCAFNAEPEAGSFARMWFHPRFLLVEGEKMSKSKGNFYTQRDLFEKGIEPAAIRLELIRTHYRSNANFTMQGLRESQTRVERWRRYAQRVMRRAAQQVPVITVSINDVESPNVDSYAEFAGEIVDALSYDLNVSEAIAALDRRCSPFLDEAYTATEAHEVGRGRQAEPLPELPVQPLSGAEAINLLQEGKRQGTYQQELAILHLVDSVLGVVFAPRSETTLTAAGVFIGCEPSDVVNRLLGDRQAARTAKDFKRSDAIRDELLAMGYAIKDLPGGKVEVRRA